MKIVEHFLKGDPWCDYIIGNQVLRKGKGQNIESPNQTKGTEELDPKSVTNRLRPHELKIVNYL